MINGKRLSLYKGEKTQSSFKKTNLQVSWNVLFTDENINEKYKQLVQLVDIKQG